LVPTTRLLLLTIVALRPKHMGAACAAPGGTNNDAAIASVGSAARILPLYDTTVSSPQLEDLTP
jgi:hypothetical protein